MEESIRLSRVRTGTGIILLTGIIVPAASAVLLHYLFHFFLPDWHLNQVPLHSVLEGVGSFVAFTMAVIILMSARGVEDITYEPWIASAFLGMGILDLFHASVSPGNNFVWLHSTAVFVGGIFFGLSWLPGRVLSREKFRLLPWVVASGAFLLGILTITFPGAVPLMKDESGFTSAAKALNLVGGLFFFLAASYFIVNFRENQRRQEFVYSILCLLFGVAGFTFQISHLWDPAWWWWHILRIVAFLTVLVYVVITYLETEQRLRQSLIDLKQNVNELEQFNYIASHDLQEPLRMVASYVQLLAKRYKGRLDKEADEFISFAVDGAQRMKQLINDLLVYSRLRTQEREFVPIDMTAAYMQALDNLKTSVQESGAEITHDVLPVVKADKTQMIQLFQHLIDNAIKFRSIERQPRIHISAVQDQNRNFWVFSIKDNGIGIEKKYFERIFIVFQQLDRKNYQATGIGLTICKRIVDRHGGRIWVESEKDTGSTFYFTLPNYGV